MAYSFEQVFAADPANPSNVAQNASVTIFAPGDSSMTPLAITDPDGQPLANPIIVNANGFGSAFAHATLDRVAWAGGGFTGFFTSYEGMKAEAVAARAAADTAAANAVTAESRTVTSAAVDGSGRLILTKADTTTVDAGAVIGPVGPQGAPGLPGVNAVDNDAAVAGYVNNSTSTTRTALNTKYASLGNLFLDAKVEGATGSNGGDDTVALQSAINKIVTAGGGTLWLPKGTYRIAAPLTWPEGVAVWITGPQPAYVGGPSVSVLARKVGYTGTLVQLTGTGGDGEPAKRIYGGISNVQVNGISVAGSPLLDIARTSEFTLDNVHLYGNVGHLLKATEWFNSHVTKCFFQNGGDGRTSAAVVFDSPASGVTAAASGNTVHLSDCEWEGNTGTDLRITGNQVGHVNGQDWTLAILVTSPKMERNTGAYPLIDLDRAGACQFVGGFFHLGPGATAPHVEQKGAAVVPARVNGFTGCSFSSNTWDGVGATTGAAVPYFFDITVGQLALSNVSMNGNPTSAFIRIGSGVGLNDVRLSNVPVTDRSKMLLDERAGSMFGYGSIPLIPIISDVAATRSVNRPMWALPDAATNTITYASVPLPSDASNGRPVRVRLHWYSDATAGAIRWDAQVRDLDASGFDITTGQSDYLVTATVPATANRTTTTLFVASNVAKPGSNMVAVGIQRLGADAADTCTGSGRILAAELLYEKAL